MLSFLYKKDSFRANELRYGGSSSSIKASKHSSAGKKKTQWFFWLLLLHALQFCLLFRDLWGLGGLVGSTNCHIRIYVCMYVLFKSSL